MTNATHEASGFHWREATEVFSAYMGQNDQLVRLTTDGARQLQRMPELFEESQPTSFDGLLPSAANGAHTQAKKSASFARDEIAADFPLLHAHSLMGSWGALEALVDDLAMEWLAFTPTALARPIFLKIKVVIADYTTLSPDDQRRHLVRELKRECKSDLKQGLGQFEDLLKAIGLGGSVDPEVRKVLFEAQQIRHLIAHRGGRADGKFVAACPDLDYAAGQQVCLSSMQAWRIRKGISDYVITLVNRCRIAEGLESAG